MVDELPGQPVEQFRVRGAAAEFSKITRRLHDTPAKVSVPQAVHHHTRRKRVILAGDPLDQRHAAAACGPTLERIQPDRRRFRVPGHDARKTGLHHLAVIVVFAAQLDGGDRHTRFVRRPE